jgi:hypothetical protein
LPQLTAMQSSAIGKIGSNVRAGRLGSTVELPIPSDDLSPSLLGLASLTLRELLPHSILLIAFRHLGYVAPAVA